MNSYYARLGMQTAWRRFSLNAADAAPSLFEKRLRQVESGAASLNLSPDSVHLAAEIAALEPTVSDDERIALILLIVVSLAALQEGSTRFPVNGLQAEEPMRRMLEPLCADAFGPAGAGDMKIAIEQLLASAKAPGVIGTTPQAYKPLLYLEPFIYHQRIRASETALAEKLAALLGAGDAAIDDQLLESRMSDLDRRPATSRGLNLTLSPEQRAGVLAAATSRLTVISGGPGTGKTSMVLAIMRLLVRLGVDAKDIALAAPTGKAAYRIGESIREGLKFDERDANDEKLANHLPEPATIHRLLGYSPSLRRFRHHRNDPLSAEVVIVDEGSMLDLGLMERLLDALRPGARLILLGDADQLPSVAAGAVFRDLLPAQGAEKWRRRFARCLADLRAPDAQLPNRCRG